MVRGAADLKFLQKNTDSGDGAQSSGERLWQISRMKESHCKGSPEEYRKAQKKSQLLAKITVLVKLHPHWN